jgi:acetyl esterase/lipase
VNKEYDAKALRLVYQSPITPQSTYDYEPATRNRTLLKRVAVLGGFDSSRYAVEVTTAPAPDGTRVPMWLMYRKDVKRDGTAPALLYAYGSYGSSSTAHFSSNIFSLVDRGVVFSSAYIRGGGELGKKWHDQGRMMNKMNTFTDFIAAAEHLANAKYAARDRIAIMGGSAGGLLMGAVTNLRPDLFRVVISYVPFVDVINTMLDESLPLTVGEFEEWGNPRKEAEYRYMRRYSPYENLAARAYPTMLVKSSYNDSQVMYWEPAKYVARLRSLKTMPTRCSSTSTWIRRGMAGAAAATTGCASRRSTTRSSSGSSASRSCEASRPGRRRHRRIFRRAARGSESRGRHVPGAAEAPRADRARWARDRKPARQREVPREDGGRRGAEAGLRPGALHVQGVRPRLRHGCHRAGHGRQDGGGAAVERHGAPEALDKRFGKPQVMGGVAQINATLRKDGTVAHMDSLARIVFGERDGEVSARAQALADAFAKTSVRCELSRDIEQEMWEKVVFLSALAAATCLFRANVGEIMAAPGGREAMERAIDANIAIARAERPSPAAQVDRVRESAPHGPERQLERLDDARHGGRQSRGGRPYRRLDARARAPARHRRHGAGDGFHAPQVVREEARRGARGGRAAVTDGSAGSCRRDAPQHRCINISA